jgi:hypothetical protein
MPNFTLEGHDKGVNCVDYFTGGCGLCGLPHGRVLMAAQDV